MPKARRPKLKSLFAVNIRRERLRKGWSQEHLGDKAGMTQSYLSQIESAIKSPTLDTVESLARALGVEPTSLLAKPTED